MSDPRVSQDKPCAACQRRELIINTWVDDLVRVELQRDEALRRVADLERERDTYLHLTTEALHRLEHITRIARIQRISLNKRSREMSFGEQVIAADRHIDGWVDRLDRPDVRSTQ